MCLLSKNIRPPHGAMENDSNKDDCDECGHPIRPGQQAVRCCLCPQLLEEDGVVPACEIDEECSYAHTACVSGGVMTWICNGCKEYQAFRQRNPPPYLADFVCASLKKPK